MINAEKTVLINGKKFDLAGRLYVPAEPVHGQVVLAHSYKSSMEKPLIQYAAETFQKRGFATLRFDFRGHGNSRGGLEDFCYNASVEDVSKAIEYLNREPKQYLHSKKTILFGTSIGALAALLYPGDVTKQVLVSSVTNEREIYEKYKSQIEDQAEELDLTGSIEIVNRKIGKPDKKFRIGKEFVRDMQLARARATERYFQLDIPTMLAYGLDDEGIDHSVFQNVEESNPLVIASPFDTDHSFNEPEVQEELMTYVLAWLGMY